MSEPYRIEEVEEHGTLRLAWDNRKAPKEISLTVILILFWLMWAPATVYMSSLLYQGELVLWFGILWCGLGWLGTLAVPIGFLSRRWSEWLIISPTTITYGCRGFLAPNPKTYAISPEGQDVELVYGFLPSKVPVGRDRGPETIITLSLFGPWIFGWQKRTIIGYWLAQSLKMHIFAAIRTFVVANNIPLIIKTHGVSEPVE